MASKIRSRQALDKSFARLLKEADDLAQPDVKLAESVLKLSEGLEQIRDRQCTVARRARATLSKVSAERRPNLGIRRYVIRRNRNAGEDL